MKFVSFSNGDSARLGALVGDDVIDLAAAAGNPDAAKIFADMRTLLASGEAGLAAARAALASDRAIRTPAKALRLLAPMAPSTILCSGSNYAAHNREKANTPISGKEPEFFIKTADCVIGPDEDILLDGRLTQKLDAETELAIVIGKPGRHIPLERALEHVFGYTIINDVTARDRQVRRNADGFVWYELGRSKAFETSAPIGPCIVTADEIPDPQALRLRTRVNGQLRQSSTTGPMIFSCAQLIAFFSVNFTLRPGMVIATGTPSGTAWSTDASLGGKWFPAEEGEEATTPAPGYLAAGDVVESEIEGIGVLRNRVRRA